METVQEILSREHNYTLCHTQVLQLFSLLKNYSRYRPLSNDEIATTVLNKYGGTLADALVEAVYNSY